MLFNSHPSKFHSEVFPPQSGAASFHPYLQSGWEFVTFAPSLMPGNASGLSAKLGLRMRNVWSFTDSMPQNPRNMGVRNLLKGVMDKWDMSVFWRIICRWCKHRALSKALQI